MTEPALPELATGGAATGGPVFVVGSMRSGSTMLRLILDSHPHVAIGPETGFMGAVTAARAIPNWKNGPGWYRRLDWTDEEFDARLREFYGGMFRRYAAAQGKRRWGDKTPFHTRHMVTMAQIFPDAVFAGIVRHPGGVAASLRTSFKYSFPDALSYWSATNLELVRAGAALGPRFVLCRYEDLLDSREPVLRELVGWLGEPWSPDLLEHHRVHREKGTPRIVEGSTSTRDPIDLGRADRWMRAVNDDDLRALESTAALASFFGYDVADATVRAPLLPAPGPEAGTAGRWLPDGVELGTRMAAFAERVDFAEHPKTLMIDADVEELADRLARVEATLARTRTRKAVRLGEAVRKVQRGRTLRDVRDAWTLLRSPQR